jgi:hypothetical protein
MSADRGTIEGQDHGNPSISFSSWTSEYLWAIAENRPLAVGYFLESGPGVPRQSIAQQGRYRLWRLGKLVLSILSELMANFICVDGKLNHVLAA